MVHWRRRRQNADYRRLGPGGGGFNAAGYEEVLARLVVDQPGVRHRCVADAAAAADHVSQLTKALATQPFKVQVRTAAPHLTPPLAMHPSVDPLSCFKA